MFKFLGRNKLAKVGFIILLLLASLSIFANFIAPYSPEDIVEEDVMPPSIHHILGTDELGRDIFSRILYGGRISLSIGLIAVTISISLGILFGGIAGFYGGMIDSFIMRIVDVFLSFPSIFLILAVQSYFPPNIYNIMIIIGLTSWMGVARLVRGEFLRIRELSYIEAARAIGVSDLRIIWRHALPNAFDSIIVAATLGLGGAIMAESALSFLGLGVQPPIPSWGNMLMEAQAYLIDAPWIGLAPGFAIFITIFSLYVVGEGMREG